MALTKTQIAAAKARGRKAAAEWIKANCSAPLRQRRALTHRERDAAITMARAAARNR